MKDNYVEWKNTNETDLGIEIKISTCGLYGGWSSVAFGPDSSINNATIMIIMWPVSAQSTQYYGHFMDLPHNETNKKIGKTPILVKRDNSATFVKFTSMVSFNISIQHSNELNYVFFACHDSIKPVEKNGSWEIVSKHTHVNSRSLWINENQCDLIPPNLFLYINMSNPAFVGISYGEWIATKSCFMTSSFTFPIFSTLLSVLMINNLRFVLLMNLNKNKSWIHGHRGSFFTRFILILKYLTADYVYIIFTVSIFVSFLVLQGILAIITNGRCTFVFLPVYFLTAIFLFSMISFNLLIIIFDIFVTVKDFFRGKCQEVFIKSDPFYFRLQQSFGVIVLIILITIGSFLTFAVLGVITRLKGVDDGITYAASIAIATLNVIISFYLSGFVLFLTIINVLNSYIKKLRGNKIPNPNSFMKSGSELQSVLGDTEFSKLFKRYCESEWSVENYLCIRDIEKFKYSKMEERSEILDEIFYTYFNGSRSELEVNVTQQLCTDLKKKMDSNHFEDEIFDDLLKAIFTNLNDTMSRFRFTSEYTKFLKTNKLLQDQIDIN
eukprot:gene10496-3017_t